MGLTPPERFDQPKGFVTGGASIGRRGGAYL